MLIQFMSYLGESRNKLLAQLSAHLPVSAAPLSWDFKWVPGCFFAEIRCVFLTKREVKMVGYWFLRDKLSRSIKMQNKNEANIQPSWQNKLGQEKIY